MPTYSIDINKIYKFPIDICRINYADFILVIAPDLANWIVLKSAAQMSIFEYFRNGHSIQEALSNNVFTKDDVTFVVTQIEARKFSHKAVHSSTQEERSMHLYLTNKCNLSCPHCYMFSGKANDKELSTEEILDLILDYKEIARGTTITISGGEPTMRTDFEQIVVGAAKMGLEVKLLTNGTTMTDERVNLLSKYLYSIQISIDGFSEESNSLIRGGGNFTKALQAVEAFVKGGVKTSIAITPPYDILKKHINDYVTFAETLSIKYKGKPFHIKFSEELIHGRQINPSKEINKEYFELMREIQKRLFGPDFEVMTFARAFRNDAVIDNCMFGVFAIASDGNVYPCARIGDLLPLANVREVSFKDIYKRALAAEKATMITNLKPCNNCELRFICGGGCRIEEFPTLVKRTSFDNFDVHSIPPRQCSQNRKNKFYDLMIRSNKYLYTPLD